MLGRDGRDGRMAALAEPGSDRGAMQPVVYQAQNRRLGKNDDAAEAEVEASALAGEDAAAVEGESNGLNDRELANRREERAGPGAARAIDRGAAQIIALMKEAMGADETANFRTTIAIRPLRNQSRTPSQEIEDLRDRLVALLDATSTEESLRFTREVSDATEYTLGATVYLIQRDGFDQWEIYFALRPVDANWTIWRNDDPVRMLRQKRAGGDSMLVVRAR